MTELTLDPRWLRADDVQIRSALNSAADDVVARILNERELESLRFGYRERVTDTHLPRVRELPLTRNKLSPENRQQLESIIDDYYEHSMVGRIVHSHTVFVHQTIQRCPVDARESRGS